MTSAQAMADMRKLISKMRDIDSKEGAKARLVFHMIAVEAGLQSGVPPWVLANAREKGVQV